MANFLRRLVAKSRSSSPQKGGGGSSNQQPPIPPHHSIGIPPTSQFIPELEGDEGEWGPSPSSDTVLPIANHLPMANHSSRHNHVGHGPKGGDGIPPQFMMNSMNKVLIEFD
jgi:hypothetical protein